MTREEGKCWGNNDQWTQVHTMLFLTTMSTKFLLGQRSIKNGPPRCRWRTHTLGTSVKCSSRITQKKSTLPSYIHLVTPRLLKLRFHLERLNCFHLATSRSRFYFPINQDTNGGPWQKMTIKCTWLFRTRVLSTGASTASCLNLATIKPSHVQSKQTYFHKTPAACSIPVSSNTQKLPITSKTRRIACFSSSVLSLPSIRANSAHKPTARMRGSCKQWMSRAQQSSALEQYSTFLTYNW